LLQITRPAQEFWVADWHVSPALSEIERDGVTIQLEPRVMAVLEILAAEPGKVFSREELEAAVWQDVVVGYDALTKAVNKLREALGDNKKEPRYIQTLSKKGYRLIAPVDFSRPPVEKSEKAEAVTSTPTREPVTFPLVKYVIGTVVILAVLLGIYLWPGEKGDSQTALVSAVKHEKPTIVVLPFRNISPSDTDDYLADGLTSDLTTNLSKLSGLWVTASSAALVYKNSAVTPETIRRQFNARYVLSGDVNKIAQKVRINVHLTDLDTGKILWADRYDRQFTDLFSIQDEVTKKILESLSITLTREEQQRLASRFTDNLLAYEYFQRGQSLINIRTPDDNITAREFYRKAIELDPEFGRAYAAVAMTYVIGFNRGWPTDVDNPLEEALGLAQRAITMGELAESYWVAGFVYGNLRKTDEAVDYLHQALQLNPNYADAYAMLSWIKISIGQADKAIDNIQTAYYLNPTGGFLYDIQLGKAYYFLGKTDLAVTYLEKSLQGNPVFIDTIYFLAAAYVSAGRLDDAGWMINEAASYSPELDAESWLELSAAIEEQSYREKLLKDLKKAYLANSK